MKIAVIGSGISGMAATFLLNTKYDVDLYEKSEQLGGHTRTIDISQSSENPVPVDTGFIVFNKRNYPLLTSLFDYLNVPITKSDMSFGASINNGQIEYSSHHIFAQKNNLLKPKYLKFILDILKFNKKALLYLNDSKSLSLREILNKLDMSPWFRKYYIQAMGAAIWSCSVETILDYPAYTFLNFFKNHGLLTLNDHPQWYSVLGGSQEYIKVLCQPYKDRIKTSTSIQAIQRHEEKVILTNHKDEKILYDKVILACHADQALKMLKNPTLKEREILGSFAYQDNKVIVHSDSNFMPKNRKAWASWVYLSESLNDQKEDVSVTYWMNSLQKLNTTKNIFVSLNPPKKPQENLIYDEHTFAHPVFNLKTIQAQDQIKDIQGVKNIYFCGAYQRYGFHEDGLLSAVKVAQSLGVEPPWNT